MYWLGSSTKYIDYLQRNMVVSADIRVGSPVSRRVIRRYGVMLKDKSNHSGCKSDTGQCSNRSDGAFERKELHIENAFLDGPISELNAAYQVL